ncbi:MAG TPA: cytochrome oxidase subunit III [Thermohalobaculum sp.]|nr:cytochrome oxidase subunit III [Thermohalobaculum sp.]
MRLTNRQWTLIGWWLFVVCAGLFIVAAARAGDMIALLGSVAFMAANIAFLIPFYRRPSNDENED